MTLEDQLLRVAAQHARLVAQITPVEERRAKLIRAAAADGMTRRKIADLVGISHQRVQQIVSSKP